MQAAYADGIERLIQAVSSYFTRDGDSAGQSDTARANTIDLLSQMIGTLVLARGSGRPILSFPMKS